MSTSPQRRWVWHAGAATLVLIAIWALATTHGPTSDTSITDIGLYHYWDGLLAHGLYPYKDFPVEYPPLALVPMRLAGLLAPVRDYESAFGALALIAWIGALWLVAALAGARATFAAWAMALAPLVTGALVRTHFDVFAVAPMLAALLALTRGRPKLGFALLGIGAGVKLFPALLVPLAAAWLWSAGRTRDAVWGIAVFVAVVAAISAPFLGRGYDHLVRFHLNRPVQIESSPAAVLLVAGEGHSTGTPARPDRFNSHGLRGGPTDGVEAAFTVLLLAALAAAVWAAARSRGDPRELILCSFAAILAFVALGKVLSPQFVIWLVPFAVLAWTLRARAAALLCAAAVLATQFEFPSRYFQLVERHAGVIALVAVRDGLLIAALMCLLVRMPVPAPLPARWRRPAAARTP